MDKEYKRSGSLFLNALCRANFSENVTVGSRQKLGVFCIHARSNVIDILVYSYIYICIYQYTYIRIIYIYIFHTPGYIYIYI